MQNLFSVELIQAKMKEDQNNSCERKVILSQLSGLKYWLFLLGL